MPGGVRTEIHLDAERTHGSLCLLVDEPPVAWSLPAHRHLGESETIHVIEGEFEMNVAGERSLLCPGETVHVPAGVVHGGGNVGTQAGRRLVLFHPAGVERFFREVGAAAPSEPVDVPAVLASAARHGWEFISAGTPDVEVAAEPVIRSARASEIGRVTASPEPPEHAGSRGLHRLPPDLPVPEDDGAAEHLPGTSVPDVRLAATQGEPVDLARAAQGTLVLYVYPRTGGPDVALPTYWDEIPGARGCTPENCAFRDHARELTAAGARVYGLSAQPPGEQRAFAEREAMPYPLLNDHELLLADRLGLPTFEAGGQRLYRRLTLIARRRRIEHVFYPVTDPARYAAEVLEWLQRQSAKP